jgi:hypothetical protein
MKKTRGKKYHAGVPLSGEYAPVDSRFFSVSGE